jgi:hypothetical protein
MCIAKQQVKTWDSDIAMVVLGYQCSPQRSTGFAPYELMFARPPVMPPAVAEVCRRQLPEDDVEAAAKELLDRRQLLEQRCPIALGNLAAAQHRDQLRYLKVRAPDYKPRTHRFAEGDYVYVQQSGSSKLQPRARNIILKVVEVKESGVLLLQGRCGQVTPMHMSHCSPCHLPDIDGSIDPLLRGNKHVVCKQCGQEEPQTELLMCEHCNAGHHTFCLSPPVEDIPDGCWLCPDCSCQGVTLQQVAAREEERLRLKSIEKQPNLFPGKQMRQRDEYARGLDQRLIRRTFKDSGGESTTLWGQLHFTDELKRPWYFRVTWEDGDITDATTAGVKAYLQPAGTRLPRSVKLPVLEAVAVALQPVQRAAAQRVLQAGEVPTPSVAVPAHDLQVLKRHLYTGLAQAAYSPVHDPASWLCTSLAAHIPRVPNIRHGGTLMGIAPAPAYLLQALHAALKHKPALLVVYSQGWSWPEALQPLFIALQQQRRAVALRAWQGWWLLICQPSMRIQQWLQ